MTEGADRLFDVTGKVVVVTGAGGVLCGEMARALALRGAAVALLDLDLARAEATAESIRSEGGRAAGVRADVLDRSDLERSLAQVIGAFGRVDVLVNGAGGNKKEATVSPDLSFFDLPAEAVRWVVDLNFMGTFLACQVFGRPMAEQSEGIIVNIASMNAFRPLTNIAAYSAGKAAVANFTQWLAVHMARNHSKRIRVNAIAPGFFLTDQNRFLLVDGQAGGWTPRARSILDHTPLDRFGEPADLVGTLLWLVSPASAFVHGAVIPVDGGFSAQSGV